MKLSVKSFFKVFWNVIFGLLLGCFVGMMYVSSTERFRLFLQNKIEEQFHQDFGMNMRCKIESVDWLACRVHISGIQITPEALSDQTSAVQDWSVMAEHLVVKGSWMSLLTKRALKIHMQFDHVIMMELFETQPEKLAQFCSRMFSQIGASWLIYEGISIKDGLLYLKRTTDGLYVQIPYVTNMQSDVYQTKMQTYMQDGVIWYHDGMSIEKINGSCICQMPYFQPLIWASGDVQMTYVMSKGNAKIPGFLAGFMRHGKGEFSLKTEDGSVVVDPILIDCKDQHCWCDMNVLATPDILQYFDIAELFGDLRGQVGIQLQMDMYDILSSLQVSILLDQLLYKSKPLIPGGSFAIHEHNASGCTGMLCLNHKDLLKIDVTVSPGYQELFAKNIVSVDVPVMSGWSIAPSDLTIYAKREQIGDIQGLFKLIMIHNVTKQRHAVQGTFIYKEGVCTVSGDFDSLTYKSQFMVVPDFIFQSLQVFDKNQLIVDIATDENDISYIVGSVDFSCVKRMVPEPFKMSFAQEGSFNGRGYFKDGILHANIQTHYAHIRIPYIYNVLQNFTATCQCNFAQQNILLKDVAIDWYEGSMNCQRALFWFDKKLHCFAMHVPIMFNKIMMSYSKGVYGLLSGRFLVAKQNEQCPLHVEGKLLLHKGEVRENILSASFHEMIQDITLHSSTKTMFDDITLDLGLLVHESLSVKTSFMSARAMVELLIQGTLSKPLISGHVSILEGSLQFPYKPIEITGGRIELLPDQPMDPVIELTARAKLKRYLVALRVWGSALDPHIQFESNPYLSEEQILSLLLLGVEDQSLSLMVPAFLTQKLQEIMFGPALSKTKLKAVFDKLLKSLKYVRFLPQFTSQTQRGGMRGVFEVDATEKLHGKIDANFAHLEDTKFDIDYSVTDDVTLRLQKDGPSTYGGEVEFSWKFS